MAGDDLGDPTCWTDRENAIFNAGWNECLKFQPGALGKIIKLCDECSDPQGWLATNVRYIAKAKR